ncbi:hypothetical protein HZS_439 [Henneguya salminicola]|nr:hypothetical protein HZS_439 [Henneguya salminicola]
MTYRLKNKKLLIVSRYHNLLLTAIELLSLLNSTLELDQNSEQSPEDDDIFNSSYEFDSGEKLNHHIDIYNSIEHIQPMSPTFNELTEEGSYELNMNHINLEDISKAESDSKIL